MIGFLFAWQIYRQKERPQGWEFFEETHYVLESASGCEGLPVGFEGDFPLGLLHGLHLFWLCESACGEAGVSISGVLEEASWLGWRD